MYSVYPIDLLHVNDNYAWAITPDRGRHAYVVDPGAAEPVEQWLTANAYELAGILITHHHWDHTNGVGDLLQQHDVPVWGPADCIAEINQVVGDGARIRLGNLEFEVMAIPGHTRDHIAYYTTSGAEPAIFCGDTLFAAGCGRLLGGTAEQLNASLQRLAQLPAETWVYCAHEYTLKNLSFAALAEPDNTAIQLRRSSVKQQRDRLQPSLPVQMHDELATNPFLRCQQPSIVESVSAWSGKMLNSPLEVFTQLRRWKDNV